MKIMETVNLAFLGVPTLRRGDQPVVLARAKGVALLLYLAVMRVAQPRDRLLDLLWPESLPQAARKNMRNTLWTIREALGADVLELNGAMIQLSAAVRVDLHMLEDGILLLEGGTVADLEAVTARYQGPLADGLLVHEAPDFEVWLTTERERVAATYLRLIERIVALQRAAGNWQAMIDGAQRALAVDPLRESAHLAIIEAHMRLSQRSLATQQYTALTDLLQRELAVMPLPETTARYEALLTGTPAVALPQLAARPPARAQPTPFVGREAELAALIEEESRATQGSARVALIAGELGIGKSRLWRTWAAELPPGAVLLASHALETDQPVPFGPLLALFRQSGPAQSMVTPPSSLAPIWVAELTRLLPEITATWPDLPPPLTLAPAEERARLFQALIEAVRPLAQPLLVLAIDDLHWADPSTLDWLVYLVDQLRDTPLLLVGTYRPQEANERLAAVISGWQRQGRLRLITLPHLTADEGHALLAALTAAGDDQTHGYWVEQSGGNPYFLIELSRAPAGVTPGDLASLVRARIQATVPANAYQMLQAAAVLGDQADLATLRATSGRTEEETLDALDALVTSAVLSEQRGTYRFVHPLVAAVVAQDLTAARRAFLHRRAAQALERLNTHRLERVARPLIEHYAAAGDQQHAAHYAELAAAQAFAVGAFVESAAYARRALAWQATPQRHFLLGNALAIAGAADEARAQLAQALSDFEQAGDVVGMMRAGVVLARMSIATGQPEQARSFLARLPIEQAETLDPALGVQARLLSAGVDRLSRAFDAAEAQLNHADRAIRMHNLPFQAALSAFERGNLLANRGELTAAIAAYQESLRLAQVVGNPMQQSLARNNLAYHHLLLGDLDAAQSHIRAAIALAEQFALGFLWQYLHSTAGEIATAQGRFDAAESAFTSALEAARNWSNRVQIANIHVNQALVARARHDLAHARTLLAEAQSVFGAAVDPFVWDKIVRYRDELAL
jgi:DNA-binding SARP family transcriptional activator/tetratricopeptide (TPR) repeat protein